jgi:hypothetical protein
MATNAWRWPWQKPEREPVRPPKVGGTRAPDSVRAIDFAKPHDFHFNFGYNKDLPLVLRRCLLVGFTTPMADDAIAGNAYEDGSHNRWLVLQQEDGRLVYAPRDRLLYIEETRTGSSNSDPSDVNSPAR